LAQIKKLLLGKLGLAKIRLLSMAVYNFQIPLSTLGGIVIFGEKLIWEEHWEKGICMLQICKIE
jgi:hypothetical protein